MSDDGDDSYDDSGDNGHDNDSNCGGHYNVFTRWVWCWRSRKRGKNCPPPL